MTEDASRSIRRRRKRRKSAIHIARSAVVLNGTATVIAAGLRLVNATSRTIYEPRPPGEIFADFAPMIVTAWHGQAFMLPFVRPRSYAVDVLASRHADGEVIARTLVRLGCGVIRGSGAPDPSDMHKKGAVAGFRGMVTALAEGRSVALTADFLKNARRQVGPGVIALARMSGRPIVPVAFVSSRRREIGSSWDRTTVSLPFGRAACVIGDPVWVSGEADEEALVAARAAVETALNAVTERAHAVVDRGRG
jgi:lysophospholipid acyltransferase (LPLAT)-like uncharacterized protein